MGAEKKKLFDRILAIALSMMLVVSLMPTHLFTSYALTEPTYLTFEITDSDANPIEGAKVVVTADESHSYTVETNESGIAAFEAYTNDVNNSSITLGEISYTVTKDDYEPIQGTEELTSANQKVEVALTRILPDIPEADYNVTGLEASYDGQEHGILVDFGENTAYTVKYGVSQDNITLEESPKHSNVGEYDIWFKISREGYKDTTKCVTLKILPIDRTAFGFAEPNPVNLVYSPETVDDLTYTNPATAEGQDPGVVTYKSSNDNIATVDENGKVTFKKKGDVTITATMAANGNYKESTATYNITAVGMERAEADVRFDIANPSVTYGDDNNKFKQDVTVESGDSVAIAYSIISQTRDGAEADVAEIDSQTGELTILTAGTVEVKAAVEGKAYKDAEATYTLTVNRANQAAFSFENPMAELIFNQIGDLKAIGGSGEGEITFTITAGNTHAVIDSQDVNGTAVVKAIAAGGNVTVTATKAQDDCYKVETADCSFTTVKADQTGFDFSSNVPHEIQYGSVTEFTVTAAGGESTGGITYSVTDLDGNATNLATITDPGSGKVIVNTAGIEGVFKLTASKEGDDNYNGTSVSKVIQIVTISAEGLYSITGDKHDQTNPWYIGDVTITPDAGYKISYSNSTAPENTWSDSLIIKTEGIATYAFYLMRVDDHAISAVATETIQIDKTNPAVAASFDNNDVKNETKFHDGRTATLVVTETNFAPAGALATVTKNGKDVSAEYNAIVTDGAKWTHDGNKHTVSIPFTDEADYTFDFGYTDIAGREDTGIVYAEDTEAAETFTVDMTAPTGSIQIDLENNPTWDKFPEGKDDNRVFNLWSNKTVKVTVKSADALSGVDYVEYFRSAEILSLDEVKEDNSSWKKAELDKNNTFTFDVAPDERFVVYVRVVDKAGNVHYISSSGVIVDETEPSVPELAPVVTVEPEQPVNGIYNTDVPIDVTVVDPLSGTDVTSGLKEVTYKVYNNALPEGKRETQKGELYTFENTAPKKEELVAKYEKTAAITVDKTMNNSNDVVVEVTAKDNAGNEIVETCNLKIDITKPVINVSYDNNDADSSSYFKENRTATIVVTERNFDEKDVVATITNTDGVVPKLSEWVKAEGTGNLDDTTWTTTVTYAADGDYTFDIQYADEAGNACDGADYGTSVMPTGFTIDKTNPAIAVSYDNNDVANETKFKADRKATITIDEHNFDASRVDVTVTAKNKEGKAVAIPDYAAHVKDIANWTKNGNLYSVVLTFSAEADYAFFVECADLSGRTDDGVTYAEGTKAAEAFTVDKTAPTGSIQIGKWDEKWTDFPAADVDNRVFGRWSMNTVTVTVNSADELSNVDYIEHFRADKIMSLDEVKASTSWQKAVLDQNGAFAYDVAPDERFVVYVRVVDKAGNVHYISSNGVIVDKTNPTVTNLAPEVTVTPKEQPVNGIYNTDVLVDVTVIDPLTFNDVMSGLKSVTYKVYNNANPEGEKVTQEGTLYTFENATPQKDDLVHKYDKTAAITVDKTKNNSNNVVIEVTAVDNAGNTTTEICKVKIDITKPTINVSYDNNDADSSKYFKKKRTATIVVTERNFDADDVVVTITNTDGVIPKLTKWKKAAGTGNQDDTTWTSTVTYKADGDYTFKIAYTDEAGNASKSAKYGDSVAPTKFTVDKVKPKVSVSYDNNDAKNGKYFASGRTATVVITEHNLKPNGSDKDRVVISIDATDNGATIRKPVVSSWKTEGNKHTATIRYAADGRYVFDIAIKDKAGNDSADFKEQEFYVDKTEPSLELTGVQENSANSGDVSPVVTYTDTNYDADQVEIKLTGANRGEVPLSGSYNNVSNGRAFVFQNFAEEKEVDDIYTLTAKVTDKAGNSKEETMSFSVNRFGSTYQMAAATEKIEGKYIQEPVDVTITEVNVNQLSNIVVTLFKNNEAKTLREGTDYSIGVSGGNGQWYRYTYTIFAKNFADDGVYSITVESNDAAGNSAKNDLDTKNASLTFGVDNTEPIVIVENLESKQRIEATEWTVNMSIKDNLKLAKVIVELNGEQTVYEGDELAAIIKAGGNFEQVIKGLNEAQTLRVFAVDAAGNGELVSEAEVPANAAVIDKFYVTDNAWVLFYTNPVLLYGTIGGIILVGGLIVYFVVRKRKEKEEKSK